MPIDLAADVAAAVTPADTTPDAASRVDASIHIEAFGRALHALVVGLPWQRLPEVAFITRVQR